MRILFKTIKRTPLTVLLFLLTAFSAAAQFPVRTVYHYPAVQPPAEIRYMDGRVDHYAIERIAKDVMRVELGNDQSTRIPLTFVESIRFQDGCTLYFDQGELQFDRLVQPAWLKNEAGDAVLEGVLKLSGPQAESLMGPDLYRQFRKHSGLTLAGSITMATGVLMLVPYMGQLAVRKLRPSARSKPCVRSARGLPSPAAPQSWPAWSSTSSATRAATGSSPPITRASAWPTRSDPGPFHGLSREDYSLEGLNIMH